MWHVTVQYQPLSSQVWHTTRKDLSFLRPKVKEEKVNFERLPQLHTRAQTRYWTWEGAGWAEGFGSSLKVARSAFIPSPPSTSVRNIKTANVSYQQVMASNTDFQWLQCWRTTAQQPVTKKEDLFLFCLCARWTTHRWRSRMSKKSPSSGFHLCSA